MRLKRLIFLVIFIFYFVTFIFRSFVILDPDFGWHLQFGRLITRTHTIPLDDTYSYTMPSYHFIDHEWGTDVVIATIYDRFGMWPLYGIFVLFAVGVLYVLSRNTNMLWAEMPLFLIGGTLVDFIGIRPQVITWTLLALLMNLLWHKGSWRRWRWYIPLLFLLWANL